MIGAVWPFLIQLVYLLCAGAALALAGWLLARRDDRGPAASAEAVTLALTAGWALSFMGLGSAAAATSALLSVTYLGWLWCLYRLFAHDERDKSVGPIRPVVLALAFVELMQLVLLVAQQNYMGSASAQLAFLRFEATFRLPFCRPLPPPCRNTVDKANP